MFKQIGDIAFPSVPPSGAGGGSNGKETSKQRKRIRGCIDHHALSARFQTSHPCFIDIRPWGSACSIITHLFIRKGQPISISTARMLLCGVLSDTVNLTSPTTTDADRLFCTLLAFLGQVEHPNKLAQRMFKAKTAFFCQLSPFSMVRADQKVYTINGKRVGWATIEVTHPLLVLDKGLPLLLELTVLKKEQHLDYVFASVVDTLKKRSSLLLCGHAELALAKEAFGGKCGSLTKASELIGCGGVDEGGKEGGDDGIENEDLGEGGKEEFDMAGSSTKAEEMAFCRRIGMDLEETLMDLGEVMSRKLEFIPPVKKLIAGKLSLSSFFSVLSFSVCFFVTFT